MAEVEADEDPGPLTERDQELFTHLCKAAQMMAQQGMERIRRFEPPEADHKLRAIAASAISTGYLLATAGQMIETVPRNRRDFVLHQAISILRSVFAQTEQAEELAAQPPAGNA